MQTDEEDSGVRTTLVGVGKGEGVRGEQEGKTVWVWRGEEGVKSSISVSSSFHLAFAYQNLGYQTLMIARTPFAGIAACAKLSSTDHLRSQKRPSNRFGL